MTTFLVLLTLSIVIAFLLEYFETTRGFLKKLNSAYALGSCRSFVLDLLILLPLVGLLVEAAARWLLKKDWRKVRPILYFIAIVVFWMISASLYLDYLSFSILAPVLGHPEAWAGNHFMWNSGIELLGFKPIVANTPTYANFWGFWNLLAVALFLSYPFVMVKAGRRLHGILFGYTEKQTGVSALFFERKTY